MRSWGGAYRGGVFLISGRRIEQKQKITKIKYSKGLRWPPFDILHTTTTPKHSGVTEGGWDKTRDHVRMFGEHDFIVLGLFSAP